MMDCTKQADYPTGTFESIGTGLFVVEGAMSIQYLDKSVAMTKIHFG